MMRICRARGREQSDQITRRAQTAISTRTSTAALERRNALKSLRPSPAASRWHARGNKELHRLHVEPRVELGGK